MSVVAGDGRWAWELLGRNQVDAPTYTAAIAQVIATRQRSQREYEAAKTLIAARAGPAVPTEVVGAGLSAVGELEGVG